MLRQPYSMSSFTIKALSMFFICFCFLLRPPTSNVLSPIKKSDTGEVMGLSVTRIWFAKKVSLIFPMSAPSLSAKA